VLPTNNFIMFISNLISLGPITNINYTGGYFDIQNLRVVPFILLFILIILWITIGKFLFKFILLITCNCFGL